MVKILIVEDNELNRDMLSRRLERKGYQVISASDGQEGVAKAQASRPDLILIDERKGYKVACTRGLKVVSTLAILEEAGSRKLLDFGNISEYSTAWGVLGSPGFTPLP